MNTPHDLLNRAASEVDVPSPDLTAILQRAGRPARARWMRTGALAVAAVTAVALAGSVLLPRPDRTPEIDALQVAAPLFDAAQTAGVDDSLRESGAFAVGSTLYLGSADPQPVELDVPSVRGLYLTSAGVLVRHGRTAAMDVASRWSMVSPDGARTALSLEPGDVSVGVDPLQPYLAYAVGARGSWTVLVIDLRDGGIAGSVDVEGDFTWGGWDAPPVSLSGDVVWVGLDEKSVAVDWRSGENVDSALPGSLAPQVRGGRQVLEERDENHQAVAFRVIDARTGELVRRVEADLVQAEGPPSGGLGFLSPDGRTLMVGPYLQVGEDGQVRNTADTRVVDLESGAELDLATSAVGGFGWSPSGQVFNIDGRQAVVCSAVGQRCESHPLDLGLDAGDLGRLKLAGTVTDS